MSPFWTGSALILLTAVAAQRIQKDPGDCTEAQKCDPSVCQLPNCFCSGNETMLDTSMPHNVTDKPQIVYLTFDDALSNEASVKFYEELFGNRTHHPHSNPNGCAIRATHFVTHSYTDYSLVNKWWHLGHEIASHSITHRNNVTYWAEMTEEEWKQEIVGQRRITSQFSAINPCEIKGMRSPFLQGGGDNMYTMLENNNFKYDCTWPTRKFGYLNAVQGLYPYTLDYKTVQDCPIEPCPTCSHPKLWVQPMLDLEDEWIGANPQKPDNGMPCSMLDACTIFKYGNYTEEDPDQVYDMLMKNFQRVYHGEMDDFDTFQPGNRAPWGLYMHAAWFFGQPWHFLGYKRFIAEISSYDDVWIVPVEAGIDYMQSLDYKFNWSNEDLKGMGKKGGPFKCEDIENQTGKYDKHLNRCGPAKVCRFPKVNNIDIDGQERYMTICSYKPDGKRQTCPEEDKYPWLETDTTNACGGNQPCADCVP